MNYEMVSGVLRHVLTVVGGYFAAKGAFDPGAVETVVGALMTLVGFGWSIYVKRSD